MKAIRILQIAAVLVSGFGWELSAQDSLPYFKIGNISVYGSADSIVGEGIQGLVSFDAATNTLFLNNASTPTCWLYKTGSSFKIKLSGNNYISDMISSSDSCIFYGPGSLTIGSPSIRTAFICSYTDFLMLTEEATLYINASECGIDAWYDNLLISPRYPNLAIDNSSLTISSDYCCNCIWNWWLSECHVVAPQDLEYQLDEWFFLPSGTIRDYLEIRPGTVGIPINRPVDCQVWGVAGGVRIDKLSKGQAIKVLNISGQTILDIPVLDSTTFLPLKPGIYIVQIDNYAKKIIVY